MSFDMHQRLLFICWRITLVKARHYVWIIFTTLLLLLMHCSQSKCMFVVCKWKDKRIVLTSITNMHRVEMVEVWNCNGNILQQQNVRSRSFGPNTFLLFCSQKINTVAERKYWTIHLWNNDSQCSSVKSLAFREQLVKFLLCNQLTQNIQTWMVEHSFI